MRDQPIGDPSVAAGAMTPARPSTSWAVTMQATLRAGANDGWERVARDARAAAAAPALRGVDLATRLRDAGRAGDEGGPRYRVDQQLGHGATAGVWAIHDRSLDRPLAAKVLDGSEVDRHLDALIAEARTTASLQHPNVVPVHEIEIGDDGRPYFTMDRVDGRSLGSVLIASLPTKRDAAVPDLNAVVSVLIAVANAVSYAHHRGVIHQDVKPDNIMLGTFGEVLLVDWGSSQRLDVVPQRICGTPLYMAPEQARRGQVDRRSDIYALGATLFHALMLRPPLCDDDEASFWRRKRDGDIDQPTADERRRVPEALTAIAAKAMATDPGARYATVEALIADLRSYQAGLAVTAQRETWTRRGARWLRRNRLAIAVALPVAATILVLVGLLYSQRLKQVAFWGQPVLHETFDDATLARWAPSHGNFAVRDGALVTTTRTNILILRERLTGDLAFEYDAWTTPGALPGDLSLMWFDEVRFDVNSDGHPNPGRAIAVPEHATQVQFGAHDGAYTMVTIGRHLLYDDARPIPGQRHHLRVELRDNVLTLAVDGVERCRHVDALPFRGGYLGLYGYYPGQAFDDVRVYRRHPPELVPACAVGDSYLRDGDHARAAAEYAVVIAAHPGTATADEAAFRAGLARWREGDALAADALWRSMAGTTWDDEIALLRLDAELQRGADAPLIAAIDRLAIERPALTHRLGDLWCSAMEALLARPATVANRALAGAYLELRDRRLGAHTGSRINAARGLLYLERWQEVLDRFPQQRSQCCAAQIALGRPDVVIDRYPDRNVMVFEALLASGRYDEFVTRCQMDNGYDPRRDRHVMGQMGETALAAELYPWDQMRLADAGIFSASTTPSPDDWGWRRRMVLSGRAEAIPAEAAAGDMAVLMALGRIDDALALSDHQEPRFYAWPRYLVGLRAAIAGDLAGARRWFTVPPNRVFTQLRCEPARTLILPWLRELRGESDALARACVDTRDRWRWFERQRAWHLARYVLGEIDEAGLRSQPYRQFAEADLLLAQAVMAERRGDRAAAVASYGAWSDIPRWRRAEAIDPVCEEFVAWRVRTLAAAR
ncbi:MAG TPA: serine/threonine-protein kinase [Planctomycetota bacterium]|nr:serine/threonine-protein kinase [Planctomycetota bacterium]